MNWITLNDVAQLEEIKAASFRQPQLIFKHSTRCSISSMAKSRLDRSDAPEGVQFHYLDLIAHRDISNKIAEEFFVEHESPQAILIKNGEVIYDESHNGISMNEIAEQAAK
jgi:bacillithiol system protein YtxJ